MTLIERLGMQVLFRMQPETAHESLDIGLELAELRCRLDPREHGPRPVAAEAAELVERDRQRRRPDIVQEAVDVMGHAPVDIAEKAQGDVVVGGLDPARTDQPTAMQRQGRGDLGGNLQGSEQPRHSSISAKRL